MRMLRSPYTWVLVLLAPGYAAVGLALYWTIIDTAPPSRLIYQHSKFTSVPVTSRAQAAQFEITEAAAGATVWRYLEWCLDEVVHGDVEGAWVDGLVYREHKPTIGRLGCFAKSVPHTVPPAVKQDEFTWSQRILYRRNPLTTVEVSYPSIRLTVTP